MSTTTTNYGLVKPELTDAADITAMNLNWDKIDTELKAIRQAVSITSGNLNTYVDVGMYVYSTSNSTNIVNVPEQLQSTLLVIPRLLPDDSTNRVQMVLTQTNHLYLRNLAEGIWGSWERLRNYTEVVPVVYGGTGANSASDALVNLGAFRNLGKQVISNITNDTVAKWSEIDSGYTYYETSGLLNDQPTQYGILLHFHQSTEVFQIWRSQSGGTTYWRSGNSQGWASTWAKVYDGQNKPTPSEIGAARTETYTVSVPTSWTADSTNGGYYQTVYVSGILATDNPIVDVVLGSNIDTNKQAIEAWGQITRITTAANSITLYANESAPTTEFNIQLKVVR